MANAQDSMQRMGWCRLWCERALACNLPFGFAAVSSSALATPIGGSQPTIGAFWLLAAAGLGAAIALASVAAMRQRSIRRELQALRLSLAAAATWSWRTDADGKVVEVEPSHRNVDWFDSRSLLGRRPWELRAGTDAPRGVATALAARAPFFDIRLEMTPETGQPMRVLSLSGAPVFSGTGRFRGYAGAAHDLTALIGASDSAAGDDVPQLRADLDQRNGQLAERSTELENALRELDSFSYSVSHDLRAPLRVVDGFATILLEDYGDRGKPLDDLGRDHLRRIVAASQRMNSMIETLLSLSRMTSKELARERVDLTQIARELSDDLRAQDHTRAIEFVIAPNLRADGDSTLLRLVLQNLLGNAWKFSARTPQVRIEFAARDESGVRTFFVRDNGAGFDMRFAEKLFGLFQRFHSANEFAGTGVGLATVQKIVRRHGGRIWAEAVPAPGEGHGATFYFTLWE
ncbi:MAG TPA: ATP-binding protein [Burkholderiaceae bacterium]|nr:ATP-binding protein [Burkholderiaceae bacterium]